MAQSYWGVEHGDSISKADSRKKRSKGAVAAGTYAGAIGGGYAGALGVNARGGGGARGTFKRTVSNINRGSLASANAAGDAVIDGQKPLRAIGTGMKAAWKVPGYAKTVKGNAAGAALGGVAAYGALRKKKR